MELEYNIDDILNDWKDLGAYTKQEEILCNLFRKYPSNTDFEEVVYKITILDRFYSTNLRFNDKTLSAEKDSKSGVIEVANIILGIKDFDKRVKNGDKKLVDQIVNTAKQDKNMKSVYSFATKYCSFHNPKDYPIYDNFVKEELKYYRNQKVSEFKFQNKDLENYREFVKVVKNFKEIFNLEKYSFKQIDQYLWLVGKRRCAEKQKAKNHS